jgi:glutamate racemase
MQPVGIFDSGVGGLGILKALSQQLPSQDLIYLADNNNLPFGQKTTAQLQKITSKIVEHLIAKHNIKLAIVACNTASVSSLAYLREKYSIPIVGVVPVVKPACEFSQVKKVAILATPYTARSEYQRQLISKYGDGTEVLSIACPGLVELIESGLSNDCHTLEKLGEYLSPALAIGVDVIGLSCTHYPFLRNQIKKLLPAGIKIIDANDAVVKHVVKVLEQLHNNQLKLERRQAKYAFYVTKQPEQFQIVAQRLIGEIVNNVNLVVL